MNFKVLKKLCIHVVQCSSHARRTQRYVLVKVDVDVTKRLRDAQAPMIPPQRRQTAATLAVSLGMGNPFINQLQETGAGEYINSPIRLCCRQRYTWRLGEAFARFIN